MTLANFKEQLEQFGFKYRIDSCSVPTNWILYHPVWTFLGILIKHILRIFDSNGK